MNKIGFHVMNSAGVNSGWVQRFRPSVSLMLAIGAGGEIPELLQVCQANPNTHFIYRAWTVFSPGDSDHFEWYLKDHGTNPLPFIQRHDGVIQALQQYGLANRCSIQAFNETGHDEGIWPAFIEFNANYVREMDRRGLSAAVLGLGPGHPAWPGPDARDSIRRAWFQARPLFEAIINARETHLVNLHEYHAVPWTRFEPWIIGKFRWMLEDVRAMGLPTDRIKVVIGESGFTDPNALNIPSPTGPNGYRYSLAQGYTSPQLANDYAAMVRAVYDPSPNLLGLCYFGLGSTPGWWEEFDLLREPGILQRLETLLVHTPPEEPPVIEIIDTPVLYFDVLTKLNVRAAPSTSAVIVTTLAGGTVVPTNGYADANGYRWRRRVEGGYCAQYPLDNPAAAWLAERADDAWKVEALARLADIQSTVEALTVLVDGA